MIKGKVREKNSVRGAVEGTEQDLVFFGLCGLARKDAGTEQLSLPRQASDAPAIGEKKTTGLAGRNIKGNKSARGGGELVKTGARNKRGKKAKLKGLKTMITGNRAFRKTEEQCRGITIRGERSGDRGGGMKWWRGGSGGTFNRSWEEKGGLEASPKTEEGTKQGSSGEGGPGYSLCKKGESNEI